MLLLSNNNNSNNIPLIRSNNVTNKAPLKAVTRSPTNARNAQKPSPIPPISHNTPASIWASSHIDVRSANANSHSCRTCNNTSAHIPGINHTSAAMPAALKPSRNSPICNRTLAATKRTNHLNATPATNASPTN